ncbi:MULTISPECIES: DUF3269 family protein [Staphylococcus]|uniref:DUF3269 domain-containing protein n=1 Tax=Staphylococcus ureilyticus TaxID=94138 RepID=A0AB34AF24_STAUR|nr:DUF3269 family protein [Staphylococcus ureilyticus]QKU17412.1 DUF3269 family protein [Staphylococcus cohnii]MCT1914020.1 DUF3269 family protein [Staphylococcus ureilyticus]OJT35344.1 hypothetical protein BSF33_04635 [Staphylococcus ureilyticus]PNZ47796.1 hypothetical protein CD150_01540 [Staphylococcus ureilyticus]GEQ01956.1 hypothetical protein SCO02_03970 [Staphylococcus ureilyticus]
MMQQYFLYRDNDEKVISVVPLENGLNEVGNFTGAYFAGPTKEMTDDELMHFKSVHNLYYEQELGSQINIFDL